MFAASPIDGLPQYGLLGTLLAISYLAIGYLTRWLLKRSADRENMLEQELKETRLREIDSLEKVLQTVLESTVALKKSNDLQDRVMDYLTRHHELMQQQAAQLEILRELLMQMRQK